MADKSPIQKAIDNILNQVQTGQMPPPTAVIVHPDTLKKDGPLTKAWLEQAERMKHAPIMPLGQGVQVTGISWDEQHTMGMTELETQLTDSLWALCDGIEPMHYQMDVLRHIPHMRGSTERIRRFPDDGHTVLILCACKKAMRFARCQYVSYTNQVQCAEECLMQEAVAWEDIRCSFHRKGKS